MKLRVFLKTNNKGFTLIELLVALAVLVLAAAVFAPALSFVARVNKTNRIKMTASSIAAGVVEETRALPYDDIGTVGGNPPGLIPRTASITIGGVTYDVETRISWGSAKSSVSGEENVAAVKNIRVTVSAPGVFSGSVEKVDEIFSTASRDSEEPLIKNGHIRVKLRDSNGMPLHLSTGVNITGEPPVSLSQTMTTDSGGEVLFGVLVEGEYTVRVKVPDGFAAGPGHVVDSDGWIIVENVEVNEYQVTDVQVYLSKASESCRIEVKLVDMEDAENGEIIAGGRITLNWRSGSLSINLVDDKAFSEGDFVDGALPYGFFGPLWLNGAYNLVITDVPGYNDYDMSSARAKPLLPDGTEWDGTLQTPGQYLEITVPLEVDTSGILYREDTKEDFEYVSLIESLAVTDNGLLVLGENREEINLLTLVEPTVQISASSSQENHPAWHIGDGNDNTYWREGNRNNTWVQWDFGIAAAVRRVEILAKESSGGSASTTPPGDFILRCSADGVNWTDLYSGTLSANNPNYQVFNISSPPPARYFRLCVMSRHNGYRYAAINEVRLFGSAGYARQGIRISQGIPFSGPRFASAPQFIINWQAETGAGRLVRVYTAVTGNAARPGESEFTEVQNGGFIPGIAPGSNIRGKYLWVMEKLETGDIKSSPSLDWLEINY